MAVPCGWGRALAGRGVAELGAAGQTYSISFDFPDLLFLPIIIMTIPTTRITCSHGAREHFGPDHTQEAPERRAESGNNLQLRGKCEWFSLHAARVASRGRSSRSGDLCKKRRYMRQHFDSPRRGGPQEGTPLCCPLWRMRSV